MADPVTGDDTDLVTHDFSVAAWGCEPKDTRRSTTGVRKEIRGSRATISPMADVQHLSRASHDRLTEELERLSTIERIDIARKIQSARELGDLSENGDYHAAREEQGKMEARIRHIEAVLENAEIIEAAGTDEVAPGVIVTIRYEGDDDTERYLIGSIEERNESVETLTVGSPLGQALLGAAVGDIIGFEAPGGLLNVEIVTIEV